ncbi:nucleotidyltransferase family protein [Novispirillum sp. DQ9]|uniref:nucleotidyltransferase family protein n=1 Tax=Novispirillum sp. DQ9 TaxID=3398612 RepID=UPI003C7C98D1
MAGSASSLAAIILAAGRGSRMGAAAGAPTKVLASIAGRPMIDHVVSAALVAGFAPVIVVLGHAGDSVAAALRGKDITLVRCPTPDAGMAASLRAGVDSVPLGCVGAAVLLGDMPGVTAEHLRRLMAAFEASSGTAIIAPTCGGRRGNPVLWPRRLFADLRRVEGDQGGRDILKRYAGAVVPVPLDDTADGGRGVLRDVDTAADLAAWRATERG